MKYKSFRNSMFRKIQFPLFISRTKKTGYFNSKGQRYKDQNIGRIKYELQNFGSSKTHFNGK